MARRSFPQAQKIKKMGVGKFRSPKNQKDGRRKIPEPEKSKRKASGNSGAKKIKKLAVGKFRKPKQS